MAGLLYLPARSSAGGLLPSPLQAGFLGYGEMEAGKVSCLEPHSKSGIAADTERQSLTDWSHASVAQLLPLLAMVIATPWTQHPLLESLWVCFSPWCLSACSILARRRV